MKLAQLLSSRLCHDLIAPVGAINSGLELLSEVEDKAEVMSLIAQSAETVARRLTYFRTAFGYSAANNFNSLDDVSKFIAEFIGPHNLKLDWKCNYVVRDTPNWGRLITNLVLNLVDIAPYGGQLMITINGPNTPEPLLELKLLGDVLSLREELVEALEGKQRLENITPKTIQAHMTHMLAEQLKLVVTIDQSSQGTLAIQVFPMAQASKTFPAAVQET